MRVLISSPDFDLATRYLSAWTRNLTNKFSKHHQIHNIVGKKATKKRICGMLNRLPIDIALINGHGTNSSICGHDNELLLDLSNVNLLQGKIVHALSCQTARTLGKVAVEHGAKAYIGYDADFIMINNPRKTASPNEDLTATLFLDPAFTAPQTLIEGKSSEEAYLAGKNAYKQSIRKALNSDVQSDDDQMVMVGL